MQILTSQNAMAYSTFKLPATLAQVWLVESIEELARLRFERPPLVLGEGSNSIFLADIQRPILRYVAAQYQITQQDVYIQAHVDAGVNWHQFVKSCVEQGWWGIENLALIPGSVGAAPVQNIGAYGAEFCDVCDYVDFYHWHDGLIRLSREQCQFGYRDSIFKQQLADQGVIVGVGIRLTTQPTPRLSYRGLDHVPSDASVSDIFQAVIALRQSKLPDPTQLANCGSFFKNPLVDSALVCQLLQRFPAMPVFQQPDGSYKLAAAWLIEQTGFKGKQADGIGCYHLQPLVLVNHGSGSAIALQAWVRQIVTAVQQVFAVTLEAEVRMHYGD